MWTLEAAAAARGCLLLASLCLLTLPGAAQILCPEVCSCFWMEDRAHLDCSNRGLTDLPLGISSTVQVLDLSNNLFDSYPAELENMRRVERINLSGNQLSVPLPQYFANFGRLEVLNLSHNKYDTWDDYGLGSSLGAFDISQNFINKLGASSFRRMSSLQFLDLSENRISTLPLNIFNENNKLETLILSRNDLDHIPKFASSSLKTLDLSMCQISSISSDSFDGKSSLLEIDLSKNLIDAIPDLLHSSTIQTLDLSYNTIDRINSNSFRALPDLAVLNLSGNEFEEIWTPGYFSENKCLKEVYLTGNRWGCEGFGVNLLLMYDYLTRDSPRVPDTSALICYTPANVTGWSWQRAYVLTWHIEDSNAQTFTYTAVLVGLVVGVALTACLCRASMRKKLRELESQRGSSRSRRPQSAAPNLTRAPRAAEPETRVTIETVDIRIPLRPVEDLPPTYDEALLMPRLDGSFHSLPEYLRPERPASPPDSRLSRSINNLLDPERHAQADARRPLARSSTRRNTARLQSE